MTNVQVVFFGVVFSSSLIALLLACGQLLIRNRNRGNLVLSAMYATIAWIQLHTPAFMLAGVEAALPHVARTGPLPRLLLGPLVLIFFREVLLQETPGRRWPHFALAMIFAAPALGFALVDFAVLAGALAADCGLCTDQTFFQIAWVANVAANVQLMIYLVPLILFSFRSRPDLISGRRVLRAMAAILALSVVAVLLNLGHNATGDVAIFDGGGSIILALVVFAIFLLAYVYPEVLHVMRIEAYDAQRRTSPLKNVDTERLALQLRDLMEEEKLFRDENLPLATVAEALGVRPNQLTYYLNHVHEKNFANFVNEYRVREARELLLAYPERSVLSVGMEVGFNSKTAFYRAFDNLTGLSPNEYRKRRLG